MADAYAGKYKGTKVTVTGPFVDADAQKFDATVADFEAKTGIDIQYQGSKEFEASIKAAMDAGNAPDIVDFPQPGLLAPSPGRARSSISASSSRRTWLKANYNQSAGWTWPRMPGKDGKPIMAGVWERVQRQVAGVVSQEGLGRIRLSHSPDLGRNEVP